MSTNEIDEFDIPVIVTTKSKIQDILLPFELAAYLHKKPELLGLVVLVIFFKDIDAIQFKTQKQIGELCGMSKDTFRKRRDELIELGVLEIHKIGRKFELQINHIQRSEFKFPYYATYKEQIKYINSYIKKLKPVTTEIRKEEEEKYKKKTEKKQEQLFIGEKVKEEIKKVKKKTKAEEKKYPVENYNIVTNAYSKYRKIGLMGDDLGRARKAIKSMFNSGHTVKEIVDCMKFFSDNQNEEEFKGWMPSWRIETIMKWMPQYKSGELKKMKKGGIEDQFEKM